MTKPRRPQQFLRKFIPLYAAGLLGVAALVAATLPSLRTQVAQMPELAELPLPALVALGMFQPTLMLAALVAAGVALAPQLGLRAHIVEKVDIGQPIVPRLSSELTLAAGVGVIAGAALALFDLSTRSFLPPMKPSGAALAEALSHTNLASILASLLYGGITEELLLRWGLMTIFAWVGWRLLQKRPGAPRPAVMWMAIVVQALLFGALHLPETAILFDLTTFVIVRGLALNGFFALAAGWLYWRRSLESAMMAHMFSHLALTVVNLAMSYDRWPAI